MKNALLLAGAVMLSLSGAAYAQQMPAGEPADPAVSGAVPAPDTTDVAAPAETSDTPETSSTPTTATEPMPSTDPAPVASATPAPAAGTTPADPARLQAAQQTVQSGWATYDADGNGTLTPLDFGKWVMAAQGQDLSAQVERTRQGRQANLPAVQVLNATAAAFSKADTNHDRAISPDELAQFLAA